MEEFRKLGISDAILKSVADEKFEVPTEIQQKAIPLVLEGRDVIGGSATGSGKTLAFGSGIIQYCSQGSGIQALVLTPTRELAEQVAKSLIKFSRYKPLRITVVYGGVSINPQIQNLRTADVVVGTPGRILDHLERGTINLRKVKILVLDEADRMLDMGFIDDVERIISQCPKERQTLLFSATISADIQHLSKRYLKNPIKVSAESYVDPSKLAQVYYDVADNQKFSLLFHLLKNEKAGLVMVFCNSRHITDFVANNLRNSGIDAMATHGGFSQDKRNRTMQQFHSKKVFVLVCTDVASRGLDIPGVSHVYNYDIPKDSKQYIHRIGRTARAGKEGIAVNLLSPRDHDNFGRVLRDNSVEVKKAIMPQIERVPVRMTHDRPGFGRPGFRGQRQGGRGFGPRRESGGFGHQRHGFGIRRHSGMERQGFGS